MRGVRRSRYGAALELVPTVLFASKGGVLVVRRTMFGSDGSIGESYLQGWGFGAFGVA